ncbi:MAG: leucyl/phenylalanyl-tRNA--protein transferase [Phycisphaerae bacterium]|nr:leucyl/phenylalanyl-tRNA--protein transferase [Phycisphaerae bacterium]
MIEFDSRKLDPQTILNGYLNGIFPMEGPGGVIQWFSPDPRCIFDLDSFEPSRSLRKTYARRVFEVRVNTAFERVIAACADREEGTWIRPKILKNYKTLHAAGFAHSVESWKDGELAGGLYGVSINGAFFGESMFHRATDASKVALVALIERMRARGMVLLDCQWRTPHLASLGAVEISREEFLKRLDRALTTEASFVDAPED